MKVSLFRDLPEEQFTSMEVYADQLVAALVGMCPSDCVLDQIVEHEIQIPCSKAISFVKTSARLYSKFVMYPSKAPSHQGNINHIVDHHYAHLVHGLDASKTIVTCHDLMPLEIDNQVVPSSKSWRPGILLAKYAYSGLMKAARIMADSYATRQSIEKYLDYKYKIDVVYLGVSAFYQPVGQDEVNDGLAALGLNTEHQFLLHVGGTSSYKNIEGLIRVLAILVHDMQLDVYLVRVGKKLTIAQMQLAADLRVEHRVSDVGFVSEHALRVLYNRAKLLLYPSYFEGFGLPILEAMACGTPVLVSTAPSLVEITEGIAPALGAGDYKGLAEAARMILTNEAWRRELSAKGSARARQFTWERTARQVLSVYQDIHQATVLKDN